MLKTDETLPVSKAKAILSNTKQKSGTNTDLKWQALERCCPHQLLSDAFLWVDALFLCILTPGGFSSALREITENSFC